MIRVPTPALLALGAPCLGAWGDLSVYSVHLNLEHSR